MSNRLQELRKINGLTQDQLSKKSGVHRTSIARYETGRNGISEKNMIRLATALHVPIDEILKGGKTDGAAS